MRRALLDAELDMQVGPGVGHGLFKFNMRKCTLSLVPGFIPPLPLLEQKMSDSQPKLLEALQAARDEATTLRGRVKELEGVTAVAEKGPSVAVAGGQ